MTSQAPSTIKLLVHEKTGTCKHDALCPKLSEACSPPCGGNCEDLNCLHFSPPGKRSDGKYRFWHAQQKQRTAKDPQDTMGTGRASLSNGAHGTNHGQKTSQPEHVAELSLLLPQWALKSAGLPFPYWDKALP